MQWPIASPQSTLGRLRNDFPDTKLLNKHESSDIDGDPSREILAKSIDLQTNSPIGSNYDTDLRN